jgi:ACR3 family arsenite transporter
MALLGWIFIGGLFRDALPADQIDSYIAGLILLAAAPCTAMVFVWSSLTKGEPHFTLSQVALNDAIMIDEVERPRYRQHLSAKTRSL